METQPEPEAPAKLNLRCTACGYGAVRSTAPERCPMCQAEDAWIQTAAPASGALVAR